jgi:hypothetical protein
MAAIHSADEELGLGLCEVERENGFRNLALTNESLEDRGGLIVRNGLWTGIPYPEGHPRGNS